MLSRDELINRIHNETMLPKEELEKMKNHELQGLYKAMCEDEE